MAISKEHAGRVRSPLVTEVKSLICLSVAGRGGLQVKGKKEEVKKRGGGGGESGLELKFVLN